MARRTIPDGPAVDPDETTLARLPRVLSAGGGDPGAATPVHDHPGDEIVLIERGRALVTAAGADLVGSAGTALLFPRGCAHDQRNQPGTRSWYVVFAYRGRAFPRRARVIDLPADEPARR